MNYRNDQKGKKSSELLQWHLYPELNQQSSDWTGCPLSKMEIMPDAGSLVNYP